MSFLIIIPIIFTHIIHIIHTIIFTLIIPISIQRWSPRRIRLAAAALFSGLLLLSLVIDNIRGVGFL